MFRETCRGDFLAIQLRSGGCHIGEIACGEGGKEGGALVGFGIKVPKHENRGASVKRGHLE
jgi:hypothetical protein